jgi:glycosyltransferase involved in cell wall biosynthesis
MIVKNESAVIERCLAAVAPNIDCYVICDTGSSDDTIDKIRTFFESRGVPGLIPRTEFKNFEQARNYALDVARDSELEFDYLLLCDADMELVVERQAFREELTGAAYLVTQRNVLGGLAYQNLRLLPRCVAARYHGVTHEYLDVEQSKRHSFDGVWFRDHAIGANRPNKCERDIALLTEGLRGEPDNDRYVFYLANSYFDLGVPAKAMPMYEKRIQMGGWAEEIFYSSYRIGQCLGQLGNEAEMVARHLQTYEQFPHRAEPLHALARHYQQQSQHRLAYLMADAGSRIAVPDGALFVESEVYEWRLTDIIAVSLYWIGRYAESGALTRRLLDIVPESERARLASNLAFCEAKLETSLRAT